MCGICGQYNFREKNNVEDELINVMTSTMLHRGPDDEGQFISGPIGFGFRRLSIIDLAGGHQPMSDMEEKIWVIFNGEIYNFIELRSYLKKKGHSFRTNSDTEVIVNGYKEWGIDVLNKLNGMFGLAIWDDTSKRLLVARDPFGIKPVYYKNSGGTLTFGSELRPILSIQKTIPEVDIDALNLFLRYRYTPSPFTLYQGVKKLAPGTMIICEGDTCKIRRWYKFTPSPFEEMKSEQQVKEELLYLYQQTIKRQLISDVPVGLLLSGGIDSGLLLGLMNLQGSAWPTFSVGYGHDYKDDELGDAAVTARLFNSKHFQISLTREVFEQQLPKIVESLEEPVAASSIVPMYFVCERARQNVTVALVGQGPDELFGGYKRHLGIRYGSYWRNLPATLRNSIAGIMAKLPRNETLKRGIYSLAVDDRFKRYQNVFSIVPGDLVDSLFNAEYSDEQFDDKVLECWQDLLPMTAGCDELGAFQFIEVRSSLPDELLMYADKLSMAHSLELRVPYLDKEIVEYVERLSATYKVRNGKRKWIHRKVAADFMPKDILRRKKRGFAVNVVDRWFSESLNSNIDEIIMDNSSMMYKILNYKTIQRLYLEHAAKKNDYHKILFSLVVFEQWLRTR